MCPGPLFNNIKKKQFTQKLTYKTLSLFCYSLMKNFFFSASLVDGIDALLMFFFFFPHQNFFREEKFFMLNKKNKRTSFFLTLNCTYK